MSAVLDRKKFSDTQKRAFEIFDKEISVSAGAGSGKTSVLVERFLRAVTEKGLSPKRILAITFTEKAAAEMKSRLVEECRRRKLYGFRRDLETAYISTIHGFCARILKENPIEGGLDPGFRVIGEGEAEILAGKLLDTLFEEEASCRPWMRILSEIGEEAARDSIRRFYDLLRAEGGDESIFKLSGMPDEIERKKEFVRIVRRFRSMMDAEKRRLASYDFEDLLFLAFRLLSDKTPVKAAVRRRYQKLFSLVLVDEYQDVSPLQDRLIDLLKSEGNLFVVGDIQQSIYGFRHAQPEVFRRRIRSHQQSPAMRHILLSENYRSRAEILSFVNGFFSTVFPAAEFIALESKKPFTPNRGTAVELLCFPKAADDGDTDAMRVREAKRLAAWIAELVDSGLKVEEEGRRRPVRYGDIAVLLRATAPARFYEKELNDRNIPYEAVKGKGFYEKPEIQDLLGFLTLVENPEDDIALAGVLRSPIVGVSDDALYWLSRHAKKKTSKDPLCGAFTALGGIEELPGEDKEKLSRFYESLCLLRKDKEVLRISGILDRILEETNYEAKLLARADGRRRVANVRKFLNLARKFETNDIIGVGDFVRYINHLSEREVFEPEAKLDSGSRDAVTLSTIHAAKGLEFPVVIIADMGAQNQSRSRGPFLAMAGIGLGQRISRPGEEKPHDDESYQKISEILKAREEAEEWRLLYVAMTRAKEKLLLSGTLALSKKDGDFKKDGRWMNRLCAAIGFQPAESGLPAIDFHGTKIGLVSPAIPPLTRGTGSDAPRQALSWPLDFAEPLAERLETKFRGYEEIADLTVTDLMIESVKADQPLVEILKEEPALENASEEELETPRNEFGTVFHRVMEIAAFKPATFKWTGRFFEPFLKSLTRQEAEEMKASVLRFWNGPLGREIRSAKQRYPELPFIYKTKYGLLKGQIDLVFQNKRDEWVVLDYKTGRIPPSEASKAASGYEFQLAVYSFVFKRLYGDSPSKGVLYFSAADKALEFFYTEKSFSEIEARFLSAFQKLAVSS